MNNSLFYTATMAKLHAAQGYYDKAFEIYSYLQKREPERQELRDALSDVKNLIENKKRDPDHLASLFRTWLNLIERSNRLRTLKKLKELQADR